MKSIAKMFLIVLLLASFHASADVSCPSENWKSEYGAGLRLINYYNRGVRAGYIEENRAVPFRGNVVYLQGLGDSMRNHLPLFNRLADEGYRVITFDYFGQGGTAGSMNEMTVERIADMGGFVYRKFARDQDTAPIILIGWSTGGLAAYRAAKYGFNNKWPDAVVLMAPGIVIPWMIGDRFQLGLIPKFSQITLETLTKRPRGFFDNTCDPHLDPIKPTSPLQALTFSKNLLSDARASKKWKINRIVKGLALFPGAKDTYVKGYQSKYVVEMNAPHFEVIQHDESFHEMDNETNPKPEVIQQNILRFLAGVRR